MKKLIFILVLALSSSTLHAQSVIMLNEESDGSFTMDATLNGVGVRTYYAPESWFASVSSTTYMFLYENGYIKDTDVNGMTVVKMPNGQTTKAGSFVIRNLQIGKIIVQNLPAFVIAKQKVPVLVGNSAFDCFGTVSQEGRRLIIDDRFEEDFAAEVTPQPVVDDDPLKGLKTEVEAHIAAGEYEAAADCFAQLQEAGVLTMYSEYQYAQVLNNLRRNDENIALSTRWVEQYAGRALNLDYWMYDGLGDCYARKGSKSQAIKYYEEAVDAYCRMFNTTEKEIKKSVFKDETLGHTLYNLAMQYATINIGKTEYYAALAAKSGNRSAVEYCTKAKIRF